MPASKVVGLAVPSEAFTELSMSKRKALVPRVRLASTLHSPEVWRRPTVSAVSAMSVRIRGRKPSG